MFITGSFFMILYDCEVFYKDSSFRLDPTKTRPFFKNKKKWPSTHDVCEIP